jgi:predicted PP-loop superfamily ATPase
MADGERNIVEEGLEMGIRIDCMKFACPLLGHCDYELNHTDRATLRRTTCHNALNYKICEAYKS